MQNTLRTNTLALLLLGISSGLPILLVFGTLSVWLREAGIERATIGFLSWAGLSYAFKFVWAPAVDNLQLPWLGKMLGRRRAWMLLAQLMIIVALVWMSQWNPQSSHHHLLLLVCGAVLLGFASATQDIVIDAYRIDIAPNQQQALLAGVAIAGYRIGMLFAGAGALEISAWFSADKHYDFHAWQIAYLCMSGFMLIGVGTCLLIREPDTCHNSVQVKNHLRLFIHFILVAGAFAGGFVLFDAILDYLRPEHHVYAFLLAMLRLVAALSVATVTGKYLCSTGLVSRPEFRQVYISPFIDFFKRYGKLALWLILVICLYRTSDIVMGVMAKVFYVDMGYSKEQISRISFTFGTIVSLLGGILGGVLAYRFGILKILLLGAVSAALSNLIFIYLAKLPEPSSLALILAISGDNLSGGLAGGAAVAFLSSLVNRQFSASQYAAFSAITLLFPKLLAGYSGQIIDASGYPAFFAITALMGLPVVILILYIWRPYLRAISAHKN